MKLGGDCVQLMGGERKSRSIRSEGVRSEFAHCSGEFVAGGGS